MKNTSAIIRIICGVVLMIIAIKLYASSHAQLADGQEHAVQMFGRQTSLTPAQAMLVYLGAGLAGFAFIIFGVIPLLKRK